MSGKQIIDVTAFKLVRKDINMKYEKLNSSADVDRYLNIKSMNGDNTKYAYDLEITNENSRSIYAISNVYGWTYKVDKNTTAVYLDGKKIADDCVYSIDEYFDVERPMNNSRRRLNSAVGTQFDEKAFDKYLDSLVDDCLEAVMEQGVEAAVLETEVPGYDSAWCATELTVPMNKAINKMKPIIREYYKAVYFGNN